MAYQPFFSTTPQAPASSAGAGYQSFFGSHVDKGMSRQDIAARDQKNAQIKQQQAQKQKQAQQKKRNAPGFLGIKPSAVQALANSPAEFAKGVGGALVDIGQGAARGVKTLGISLGRENTFTPKGSVEQAIYGKSPVEGVVKSGRQTANSVGGLVGSRKLGNKLPTPVAGLVGALSAAANITPVGLGKATAASKVTNVIDKAKMEIKDIPSLSKVAKNSIENSPQGIKLGGIKRAAGEIDNASAKPIRFKTTSEGHIVIEDGRHRLEAARKAGIKDFPMVDVTPKSIAQDVSKGTSSIVAVPEKTLSQISQAGNGRAASKLQTAIENAHNAGDTKTVESLIPKLPKNLQDSTRSALGMTDKLPEFNVKKVGGLDKAFRSTRSIIERSGEHGKQLAGMLQGSRDKQELFLANLQKQAPTLTKLARGKAVGKNSIDNKAFENFVNATQGLEEAKTPQVAKAVEEWKAIHPQVRERAVAAGLDVGNLGPNYYPHFINFDEVYKNNSTFNKAVNHLVTTGQAKTNEEAIKLLGHARDVSRNRQFGNLEASRLIDLPQYDKTPNSLVSYLSGSAHRIAQTETFGKKDEKALSLIAKAGLQGHDIEAIKNAYDVAVGAKTYNPTTSKISGNIRKYITTTRLGLGAITNAQQNINTGVVTGHLRTLGAMFKQFSPAVRERVADTGVISDAVLSDLRTQAGYSNFSQKVLGKIGNKITAPGFKQVEKFNRSVAATAGRDYGLRLAQKGKEDVLRKLGVTGEIKGKTLTEAQQIQVARKVVEKTQFKVDPQDLPGWADTPGGKLVSQFRTFSYNQGKFFSNEILKPAAKGNLLPLGRLLAALPVGYAIYEGKRAIQGQPPENDPTKKGLAAFQEVGGAGLALDIYNSLNPPGSKYIPADRRTTMAVGAFGGPAVGVAAQAVGAASDVLQRKNTPQDKSKLKGQVVVGDNGKTYTDATSAARFGLSQVPIIGNPIKNRVLPYTSSQPKTKLEKAIADVSKNKTSDKSIKLKASMSPEDYQLSQLSKKQQQTLVDKKLVSQDKINGLRKYTRDKKKQLGYYKK